jgi:hypothetical protein
MPASRLQTDASARELLHRVVPVVILLTFTQQRV